MNKKRVNNWLLKAKEAIVKAEIIGKNGKVDKAYRSQISNFGAAVVMGSLKSAVAFYVNKGDAKVDRSNLLVALYYVICDGEANEKITPKDVLKFVCENDSKALREMFTDAAIAIKLALNFFDLEESD